MKTYFLSYARLDQAFALRFAHDLKAAGVDVWVDQLHIGIGQNWDRGVEAAIRSCDGFIIILSPRSVASENVADEVSVAIDGAKQIIPILHEKCTVPMRLARAQFIDATADYPGALQRCTRLILGSQPSAERIGGGVSVPTSDPTARDATCDLAGVPEGWQAQVLQVAEQKLVPFVGPVARLLVQKAARGTHSEAELYRQLAGAIPKETERLTFLKSMNTAPVAQHPARPAASSVAPATSTALPPASVDKLPPALVDKLCLILTVHLGPIARHVLIREAREAKDRDDLYRRLGARIPTDKERAELLRVLQSH